MAKESPKWTNNTKPRHIRQGADVDKDQERRNPHGAWKKEEEGGRKKEGRGRRGGRRKTSRPVENPVNRPPDRTVRAEPGPANRTAGPETGPTGPQTGHAGANSGPTGPPTGSFDLDIRRSPPPPPPPPSQTEEYTEHFEEDTSSSTADVEEHVELYTDYGSASIIGMTDIEELYTDYGSDNMDDMVEHHLEDDIDELYIDNGSSSMDVMVEQRHDYDIDNMAEPHLDSTLNTADAPTYPYLANGATYEDRGPPRWHHHMDHQERPQHDRHRHASPSSTRHNKQHAKSHASSSRHGKDRHRLTPSHDRRRPPPPHGLHRHPSTHDLRRHHSRHGDEIRRREPRHEDLPHKATSTSCATTTMAPTSSYAYGLRCYKCKQQGHLPRECPNLLCEVCKAKGHVAWQCTTPSAKKLYFDELNAQVSKMPPLEDDLGGDGVEHGEHGILPSPTEAHGVEMVEHGMFPSTKEAHGDEQVEPTPICLIDELVPIPCEHESHLAHLSESDSELSDFHPICEFECFHLEDMSDTQSELREVDDRSMEDIAFANTLTSPSLVSSYVALGSTEDEFPLMEKMYMVHEDDDISPCLLQDGHVDHMDPPTSTTPTSHESAFKGADVDKDQERRNPHGAWKKEEEGGRKKEGRGRRGGRRKTSRSQARSDRAPDRTARSGPV
ncbi:hypothetical protein QYE76_046171 [Lolium multiflorum]|uniref:CCHC-type domain-containing protein n=1 Tax=Lolium multiflorum TaxID=4521 RepID=A0AAD8X0U6_LOLMU|nr:hypothetical protein QYE76_046171 [Lolium multiflorum]